MSRSRCAEYSVVGIGVGVQTEDGQVHAATLCRYDERLVLEIAEVAADELSRNTAWLARVDGLARRGWSVEVRASRELQAW